MLEGEVEHTLGDQRTSLRAGDLIVVPRGVPHRLINRAPPRQCCRLSCSHRPTAASSRRAAEFLTGIAPASFSAMILSQS